MISRTEFYTGMVILCGIILYSVYSTNTSIAEIQQAKIDTKDSVLQVQRDSALHRSLQFELKADSLMAIVNRKKLDIENIKKKYETDKKNILVLGADSTLSFFQSSIITH